MEPCRGWRCVPTAIYKDLDIQVPFVMTDEFSVRVTKINFHPFTAYVSDFTSISNSLKLLHYQAGGNQMTLNHTALFSLVLAIAEVFNLILMVKTNSSNIFTLCKTELENPINSCNFYQRGYLPSIQMASAHMYDLAIYEKEKLPFAHDLSLENSGDFYLSFNLVLLQSVSSFSSIDHSSLLCAKFLMLFLVT